MNIFFGDSIGLESKVLAVEVWKVDVMYTNDLYKRHIILVGNIRVFMFFKLIYIYIYIYNWSR